MLHLSSQHVLYNVDITGILVDYSNVEYFANHQQLLSLSYHL